MIYNGNAAEVRLTLLRQRDMDDAMFDHDAELVAPDPHTLTAVPGRGG